MLEPTWVPTGLALAIPLPSDRLTEENNDTAGAQEAESGPTPTPPQGPQQHKGENPANTARNPPKPVKLQRPPNASTYKVVSLYQVTTPEQSNDFRRERCLAAVANCGVAGVWKPNPLQVKIRKTFKIGIFGHGRE